MSLCRLLLLIGSQFVERTSAFVTPPPRCLQTSHRLESNMRFGRPSGDPLLDEDDLSRMQRESSQQVAEDKESNSPTISTEEQFVRHQQQVFDDLSGFFGSDDATPPEVVPIIRKLTNRIVQQMIDNRQDSRGDEKQACSAEGSNFDKATKQVLKVLDVGCGTGVLFPYLMGAADKVGVQLQITGLDLSPKMAELAKIRASNSMRQHDEGHKVNVVNGEFVTFVLGKNYVDGIGENNEDTAPYRGSFDGVITNACFGNFYNTEALMTALTQCLRLNGIMFVTHPLGAGFVQKLHDEDPTTVPHPLPTRDQFESLSSDQPLTMMDFEEQTELLDKYGNKSTTNIYFASAKRTGM